jgi:hypothetical protein
MPVYIPPTSIFKPVEALIIPTDDIILELPTERAMAGVFEIDLKFFRLKTPGIYKITLESYTNNTGYDAYVIARSKLSNYSYTIKHRAATYTLFTLYLPVLYSGDTCSISAYSSGGFTVYVRNVKVMGTEIAPDNRVILD